MTCTIGFVDNSVVIIASDSAAISDNNFTIRRGLSKVWRTPNNFLVGYAGDFSICQWIRYTFEWPVFRDTDHDGLHKYLVKVAMMIDQCLRKRFLYEGHTILEDWQLLIGCPQSAFRKASLFAMYANGDIEESLEAYAVIGSAAQCALGSLYATKQDTSKNAWDHIQTALEAAAANDLYIKRPWQVLHT